MKLLCCACAVAVLPAIAPVAISTIEVAPGDVSMIEVEGDQRYSVFRYLAIAVEPIKTVLDQVQRGPKEKPPRWPTRIDESRE